MEPMIRLKCPYAAEPKWQGRFSDGDTSSWQNVNSDYMSRLQPHAKKDPDEYWMTYGDFRCNFGGLFIISSPEPFRMDGFNIQRTYRTYSDAGLHHAEPWTEGGYEEQIQALHLPARQYGQGGERRTNSDSECHMYHQSDPASAPCSPTKIEHRRVELSDAALRRRLFVAKERDYRAQMASDSERRRTEEKSLSPTRQQVRDIPEESSDSKNLSSSCLPSPRRRKSAGEKLKDSPRSSDSSPSIKGSHGLRKTPKSNFMKKHSLDTTLHGITSSGHPFSSTDSSSTISEKDSGVWASPVSPDPSSSVASTSSFANTPEESHATSPVFTLVPTSPTAENSISDSHSPSADSKLGTDDSRRPTNGASRSGAHKVTSSNSLNSLTQSSFLAPRADFFRSDGKWKVILEHKDAWRRDTPSADRTRLDIHSKSHRVYFLVTRHEIKDPLVPPTLQEKRHVLVSLIQDYRHGAGTANSLLVPIGFCLYRTKHYERDEKRHISKLHLVGQIDGEPDRREVTARFDLDPGGYFLVPYYHAEQHQGEFLLRVLTESDLGQVKAGW
ncbi:hypothetical protein Btru_052368 [Bulinus truncatus]|nr:hypothetical protein Btru_052368 [Bulinus truncatus]